MGDYLIGSESFIATRMASTADYTSCGYAVTSLDSYAYHRWDPSSDGLDERQTPIVSEGAAGCRMGQDSRQGHLDEVGGSIKIPQMNFGNIFWAHIFESCFGTKETSTIDVTAGLYYARFFPATNSGSFTAKYLELMLSRHTGSGAGTKQSGRWVGGRTGTLTCEMETGGKLQFTPDFLFRNTESTTRTSATSVLAWMASEAFPVSFEMSVTVSATAYTVRTMNWEFVNGFIGQGLEDHAFGSRYRQGISWSDEDAAITGSLTFREPQYAMRLAQLNHTAMEITLAATAAVAFTTISTAYPAIKIHFPKTYIESSNDKFKGMGRIPHEIPWRGEKDPDGANDFAQAAIQLEIWNNATLVG